MVSKATKRKVEKIWNNQCAICGNNDFLEFHHIVPKPKGETDQYDNIILLCAGCHSTIHRRDFNPDKYHLNTSIDYASAVPVLDEYFANKIGSKETKRGLYFRKSHTSTQTLIRKQSVHK